MEYNEFHDKVCTILNGKLPLDEYGAILYTSLKTVQKGDFYILGLNPGGNDDYTLPKKLKCNAPEPSKKMTIGKSLESCCDENYNEYSKSWLCTRGAGNMPLQLNLKNFTRNILHKDIKDICCTNLIFKTTKSQNDVAFHNEADACWEVHKMILEVIQPKLIIAYGNGDISPYEYLHCKLNSNKKDDVPSYDADQGNYRIKGFKGTLDGRDTYVLGLPHLSRYWVNNDKKYELINEFLDSYIPQVYLKKWRDVQIPINHPNVDSTNEKCSKTSCHWISPNSQLKA